MFSRNNVSSKRGVVASTVAVSVFVIFTKIVGFVRQAVVAAYFGATAETDAFFLTSGFVMSFGVMIFSSLSVTLLTMYVNEKERGKACADELVSSALKLFIPVAAVLALLMCIFSDALAFVLAPAYDANELETVSHYLRLLCVVAFLYCPYLILNAVLEANKVFLAGRVLALLQSVLLIVAAMFFSNSGDVLVLVFAFALASVINLVYIGIRVSGFFSFKWHAAFLTPQVKGLVILMAPVLLGNAVLEVNSIVERGVASALAPGSVSALTYGWSVYEIVTGVVVSSLASVLFAFFADYLAKGDMDGMSRCLEKCTATLTLVLAPVTVAVVLCSDEIVSVLYLRGNFGGAARAATSVVVATYAIGFVPTAIRSVLTKAHYAFQDSKTPMVNGIATVVCGGMGAMVLAIALDMGIAGIGIAVSASMFLSAALYQRSIAKRLPSFRANRARATSAAKTLVSVLVSAVSGYAVHWLITFVGISNVILASLLSLACVFLACAVAFYGSAWALRLKELSYLSSLLPSLIYQRKEQ